jgi:hypothetical protein
MEVVKQTKECAYHINANNGSCLDDNILSKISKFAQINKNIKETDPANIINKLKNIYNCSTEVCVLNNSEVQDLLGESVIKMQLDNRFKPEGPYNSTDWFSNNNIDNVLTQIEKKYKSKKFLHIFFQMRDFEKHNSELANVDFVKKYKEGVRCFGVVFNTDYSSGTGQHWFAVFGDFSKEPFTLEYFNSSGDDPLPEITAWLKKTKHALNKQLNKTVNDVVVTKLINQEDRHSCGSYSIFYIISRLEGVSYKYFNKNKIGDDLMHEFRKNLFRHNE